MENLLALLFHARDVAHIHHWKTKSFSKHLALGELYELLLTFADELAEMYMGDLDASNQMGDINSNESAALDQRDVSQFISELHTRLETLKSTIPQKDWLINKYEELQAEVSKVKYKITNLN